jgi:Mitochondrial carrier protein
MDDAYGCCGPRGMWRGTGPTVWRLSLGAALHFTALDALKSAIEARRPGAHMLPPQLTA